MPRIWCSRSASAAAAAAACPARRAARPVSPAGMSVPSGVPVLPAASRGVRGAGADLVIPHAQADQLFYRPGIDIPGDHGDDHRVAGDLPRRVPVQPGAAVPGGHRGGRAVGGPPGPVLGDPRVLQHGVLVHLAQVGKGDVHQRLDRLPGPLRQQIRGQQPAHRLGERVVVALRPGPQILAPGRCCQRVQHRLHHRRALWGQVAADDSGPVKGGLERDAPVQVPVVLAARVRPGGAVPDLRADRRQRPQPGPGPGGRHHDLLRLAPELPGDRARPLGHLQGRRPGQHVPLGQRAQQHRVVAGQGLHGLVLAGLAPGHPGGVHQPGPGRPLPVGHRAVLGVEGLQEPAPHRRPDRVGPLQHLQPSGQHLGRQLRRVQAGQGPQHGLQHL